jgi:stage III sporulation protein AG
MSKKDKIILLIAVILLGLILINATNIFSGLDSDDTSDSVFSAEIYKANLEKQLKTILSQIPGVGEVDIMITLEGEVMKEIAYNETTSTSATQTSESKDAILVKDANETTPYIVKEKYPEVIGVVVVAQGAENSTVKYYIIEAVKAALDIGSHKIVVIPKNQ